MIPVISTELGLLFEAIRSTFIGDNTQPIQQNDSRPELNTDRLLTMARLHKLRPVLLAYDTDKKILPPDRLSDLEKHCRRQALRNLANIREFFHVSDRLASEGIVIWPMKGSLFVHAIYRNLQIREFTDVDILCRKEDVKKIVRLLTDSGYDAIVRQKMKITSNRDDILSKMLDWGYHHEIKLFKHPTQIDLHWDLFKPHHGYGYPVTSILDSNHQIDFYGKEIPGPSAENIFWTLVLHHAGVEQWKILRHLADLISFMKSYGHELDFGVILEKAKSYRLYTSVMDGFWLLRNLFDFPLPEVISTHLENHDYHSFERVVQHWESSDHQSGRARHLHRKIWINRQDPGFSRITYMFKRITFYVLNKRLKPA